MKYRNPLAPSVTPDSAWPYGDMPEKKVTTGPWKLGMSRDGAVVLWPMAERFPREPESNESGLLTFAGGERKELERFQITFCRLGYEKEPMYVHDGGGDLMLFNWRSFTLSQVYIASQVAHAFLNGDRDGAWAIGRAFQEAMNEAQDTAGQGS